jgi:hypothetical protein
VAKPRVVQFTGDVGLLLYGYEKAARFRNWQLELGYEALGGECKLYAITTYVNNYWSRFNTFAMLLKMGPQAWWKFRDALPLEALSEGRIMLQVVGNPEVTEGGMEWDDEVDS